MAVVIYLRDIRRGYRRIRRNRRIRRKVAEQLTLLGVLGVFGFLGALYWHWSGTTANVALPNAYEIAIAANGTSAHAITPKNVPSAANRMVFFASPIFPSSPCPVISCMP